VEHTVDAPGGRGSVHPVLDIIIAVAVAVLLAAGFWWTRGAGGLPGGIDDPARQEFMKYTPTGRRYDPGNDE
jgi:hypothetical protein